MRERKTEDLKVRVTPSVRAQLAKIADAENESESWVVREAIKHYLESRKRGK
jgi:predicted transcriptional regulator